MTVYRPLAIRGTFRGMSERSRTLHQTEMFTAELTPWLIQFGCVIPRDGRHFEVKLQFTYREPRTRRPASSDAEPMICLQAPRKPMTCRMVLLRRPTSVPSGFGRRTSLRAQTVIFSFFKLSMILIFISSRFLIDRYFLITIINHLFYNISRRYAQ